ncbi:MAG: hypothetical protein HYR83_08190 [Planctomycetes bacterium]|nr:hypothetical protein [Planctomycetota bacterium]
MHRTHLRKHENILKRLLTHAGGFNLSLVLRKIMCFGTARSLQGFLGRHWTWMQSLRRALQLCQNHWSGLPRGKQMQVD